MALPTLTRPSSASVLAFGINLASVAALGALSFVGMYSIVALIPVCGVSFFLAAFVEAHIYQKDLTEAIESFGFNNALYLKRRIGQRYLNNYLKYLKDTSLTDNNPFLLAYQKQVHYLKLLEDDHHASDLVKKRAKTRLNSMLDFFVNQTEAPTEKNPTSMEQHIKSLLASMKQPPINKTTLKFNTKQLQSELKWRPWILRAGYLFALGAGLSTGFAAMSSIQVGLFALGISAIPGGAIAVLSVGAAIGYTWLMYQAIHDILAQDTLNVYAQKFKNYCQRKTETNSTEKESVAWWLTRCAGLTIAAGALITLTVFATLATAGSWWFVAKDGCARMLHVTQKAAAAISRITVILMTVPTMLFAIKNSLPTLKKMFLLPKMIKEGLPKLKNAIKAIWEQAVGSKKGWHKIPAFFRLMNPFTVIAKLLKGAFLAGHFASIGALGSVGLPKTPGGANIATGGASEGFMDMPYVSEIKDNDDEEGHNHNHDEGLLLQILYLPITFTKCIAVGWDLLFSGFANFTTSKESVFGKHKHHANHATIETAKTKIYEDKEWHRQEMLFKIQQEMDRLGNKNEGVKHEKKSTWATLYNEIKALNFSSPQKAIGDTVTKFETDNLQKLREHRYSMSLFFDKHGNHTHSMETVQTLKSMAAAAA